MKMKLFRLMYETLRDSDVKVKKIELIKQHYVNSSTFKMGYLLGDVTDKFNVMLDISLTPKKLYREWKPIEHINTYEQIANLGIDVGHIIDMIKAVDKRARGQHLRANEDIELTKNNYLQYYVEKQLKAMSPTNTSATTTHKKKHNKLTSKKIKPLGKANQASTKVKHVTAKKKPLNR